VAPSFGSYIGGCLAVIGIVAALGLGGYWLRRWIVPEFSGALARLADATIAVALLVVSLQILGAHSLLYLGWIVIFCIAVGLGAAWLGWRQAPDERQEVTPPRVQTAALVIAVAVASFTVAEWTFPTQLSLDQGMFGGDTTWYHMPFSAAIAQEHSTASLHFTDPLRLAAWFYPASTELINGASIVLFKSDWLAPLQNLFWLPIALLAAWCVGRPYKVGPATLVAAAIVLDAGVMIARPCAFGAGQRFSRSWRCSTGTAAAGSCSAIARGGSYEAHRPPGRAGAIAAGVDAHRRAIGIGGIAESRRGGYSHRRASRPRRRPPAGQPHRRAGRIADRRNGGTRHERPHRHRSRTWLASRIRHADPSRNALARAGA
jgi:hypothetical protein